MLKTSRIVPCLWFENQGEEAANFYVSVFENSRITRIARYLDAGNDFHRQKAGSVMTVEFELDGQPFLALNGGPAIQFTEAVSFQILCETQEEIDYYWEKLSAVPESEACGWVKDKFGISWQIEPANLITMINDPDREKASRVFTALLKMKKLSIAELQAAFDG